MAKTPRTAQRQPAPVPSPVATQAAAEIAKDPTENATDAPDTEEPVGPKRWLKMATSLAGPRFSVSPGDERGFDDTPATDGGPSEAQRLVDAGFAVDCDPPVEA